jgi:hypothetical protein
LKLAISKILVSQQFSCSLHNLISNFSTRLAFRIRVHCSFIQQPDDRFRGKLLHHPTGYFSSLSVASGKQLPCFCYLCSASQSLPGFSVNRRKRSFDSDGWACSLQGRLPLSLSRTSRAPRGGDVDYGTDCFLSFWFLYFKDSHTVLFFKQSVIRSIF